MDSPAGSVSWPWRAFAWGGALLFAASLGYFLFTYGFTFGETQQTAAPGAAAAVIWNFALFTIFALHHSLFARERVRALVARSVPAPLERSFYVWVASLLLIVVCAWWQPVGGVAWSIAGRVGWLMYGVLAAGVWLSVRSAAMIDVWELAGVSQVSQDTAVDVQPEALEFKTNGPYGLVRHPIYLGWFLMVFGVPVMTGTRLVFALVSCGYLLLAIPLEEGTLLRTTGGKYAEYVKAVRWKLVPGVY